MPCPLSRYQAPLTLAMSMPATIQSASSAAWVPERSPRVTNGAPLASIAFSAVAMSLPFTPAGSLFGPISTKSLYITSKRLVAKPSATNFSSCGRACINTTSASPRRAPSSTSSLRRAITVTSMPVLSRKIGSR